jgi:predicted nucleic acid-binding protein
MRVYHDKILLSTPFRVRSLREATRLDDQLAREQARKRGLCVKGTLGVTVEAFRRRLLSAEEVELIFQAILDRDELWISDALVHRVWDAWRPEVAKPR